ncbi:TonB-dependent receptor [Pelagicoccus sp. SDUM812003]|uniref:TonB-dependent receptor n=1 Tax=Pelagicoccus sp. SDUM812003 TaxID=3041267 RepID=UPI00280E7933|nr:TonB-dependent receptor [Pelagicoccus sp. SDUM812003]MDQ8202723.1 TonB-dependent receptor [Pelagicoccus sp. SDUM812003]
MVLNSRNTKSTWGFAKLPIFAMVVALFVSQGAVLRAASTGIVSGSVLDADFGGGVLSARVTLVGTDISATTDLDGRFILTNVPEGEYTLIATANYYKSSTVEELAVSPGDVAKVNVPLYGDDSDIVELDSFTVKATILESSDLGLLSKRQKSASVGDAIGAEAFSRLGLGDAADAMSKVTGASIVDGKYVVMRGLSDRYNNTTLNGTNIPSSDPNRKAVQLDQFPSGLIDVISTSKTFTPDKSGEFTGGSVDIQTKAFPDQYFFTASIGFGFRDGTTGEEVLSYPGGGDDWMGKDDGTRALPALALDPQNLTSNASVETRDELIRSFSTTMSPIRSEAPMDQSWSIALGDNLMLGGRRFGYVASLSYSREYTHQEDAAETRYETRLSQGEWVINELEDFEVDKTVDNVNVGALLNLSYQLAENHEVGLKNFYSQSGSDQSVFQQGSVVVSEDIFLRESRLHFTERQISSHQLYGKHQFENLNGLKVEWDYSDSSSSQDEPDFRLFFDRVRLDNYPDPEPGDWGFPVGSTNQRLFRELQEDSVENGLDVTIPLPFLERNATAKVGYRAIEADRSYDELALGFGRDPRGFGVPYLGDRTTFLSDSNIGLSENGFLRRVMIDVTDFVPTYDGTRNIDAMYGMVDIPFGEKYRLIAGVRKEDTQIEVLSTDRFGNELDDRIGSIDQSDTLPSVNFVWSPTKNQNVRLAYSETIARPNFRELSPVAGYSALASQKIIGNPDLELTNIENYDLRWEWFLQDGDLLAVSVFKKDLINPIEQTVDFINQQTWQNVDEGEVSGFELEARKQLPWLSGEFHRFTVGGNFSIIDSEVTRPDDELTRKLVFDPETSSTRELQGQSDQILNLDVTWEHFSWGSSFTFNYNSTGTRLSRISVAQLPDVYEDPGETLDFIYTQRFGDSWKLKLKASNILRDSSLGYHEFLGGTYIYHLEDPSTKYSLGLSYSL